MAFLGLLSFLCRNPPNTFDYEQTLLFSFRFLPNKLYNLLHTFVSVLNNIVSISFGQINSEYYSIKNSHCY